MNANREGERVDAGKAAAGDTGVRLDTAADNNDTGRVHPPSTTNFEWQQLSLDRGALAPLAQKPTAPFAESEQKKAITVARFYAECHLNGVDPWNADSAAEEAQNKYDSWWVRVTAKQQKDSEQANKRQKVSMEVNSTSREDTADEGDDSNISNQTNTISPSLSAVHNRNATQRAKQAVIETLRTTCGDTTSGSFLAAMNVLVSSYSSRGCDARWSPGEEESILDGTWFTLSKPTFSECLGQTRDSEYLYRLGRLSFDMFRPTSLLCSIQGCFNRIGKLEPEGLRDKPLPLRLFALRNKPSFVRRYDISESLTIEAGQTRDGHMKRDSCSKKHYIVPRPIKGVILNEGFCVPDPNVPNRISVWFISGKLTVEDSERDLDEWTRLFDRAMAPPRGTKEMARVLAAKLLLGAQVPDKLNPIDSSMSYQLHRPIGGHGSAYVDVLYCDESLRILRGHQGSIYVSIRSL